MKTTEQHRNVVVRYVFLTIGAISRGGERGG